MSSKKRGKAASRAVPRRTGRPPKRQPGQASEEERDRLIAIAAYYRAERRGFAPGRELEDWLAAEAEVEAQLASRRASAPRGGV